jgi:hypothetical protein
LEAIAIELLYTPMASEKKIVVYLCGDWGERNHGICSAKWNPDRADVYSFSDPRSDRLVIGSLVGYYLHPMVVNFGSLCVLALSPDPSHVWYSLLGILRPSERSG